MHSSDGGDFTGLFIRKEKRSAEVVGDTLTLDVVLQKALMDDAELTAEQARSIPALYAGVRLICGIISMLPIHLYSEEEGKTQIIDDYRADLLNDDTNDLLDGTQFKAAVVEDYLLTGGGYAYVYWQGTKVQSLHYVRAESVEVMTNSDAIFKTATYNVQGRLLMPEYFFRILNGSRDGVKGRGIVNTCNHVLDVARQMLAYERALMRDGGNKKGFLKAKNKLTETAMVNLRAAWSRLWSNNSSKAMVLNDGIEFQETSATSVEMQLAEHKSSITADIGQLLNIPPSVLDGTATENTIDLMIKTAIMPILSAFEAAANRALLLESEKDHLYFAFDTKELTKTDILKRFQAYRTALDAGWLQIDEVRYIENLPAFGMPFVKLGLQDVFYNLETGEIYTPNTDKRTKLTGGGEDGSDESGDPS